MPTESLYDYADPTAGYQADPTGTAGRRSERRANRAAQRQAAELERVRAALAAERARVDADPAQVAELEETIAELRERIERDRRRTDNDAGDPSLSPLAFGLGGAAGGAVVASFLGRTTWEGAVVGGLIGAGYSYAMAGRR